MLQKTTSKRALEMFALKLKLTALGARMTHDTHDAVTVECPPENRDEVVRVMAEHGIVAS